MPAQTQKYTGVLISASRRDTQNAADVPTSTSRRGIENKDFVRALNYAQQNLERIATAEYPFVFQVKETTDLSTGQRVVPVIGNIYLDLRIKDVEYSRSGREEDYNRLAYRSNIESPYLASFPSEWYRENSDICLNPPVSTSGGKVRVTYQRTLDSMAVRVGQITAITLDVVNNITSLTVNAATDEEQALTDGVTEEPYVCISNKDGIVKAYNIPYISYNTGTGQLNLPAPAPIVDAASPPAIGDFVTVGLWTTTHSKLPFNCEQYLIEYCNRKIKIRESKPSDWQALDMVAQRLAKEIAAAYAMGDSTAVKPIPLTGFGLGMLTAISQSRINYR
jgi:hypothetical protein